MKKNWIFLLALLLTSGITVQAQLKFGLKAGVNLSNVALDGGALADNLEVDNFTGFHVGPIVEITVPILGIGLDAALLYSNEGFKVSGVKGLSDAQTALFGEIETYKTNNLLVPVNLKYKLNVLNLIGAYAAIGPYAKFNIDKMKEEYESKTFAAGLNFGIGVELLGHLQVGVNYQLGLTSDYNSLKVPGISDVLDPLASLKGKPQIWTISAAYLF
ncbi:MAG: PorT family protein [Candidatus Symbiothrix sp.]|jgi:hypothetical protein|nr:PorT family protein [Candidatus Symbiothrix sp.]